MTDPKSGHGKSWDEGKSYVKSDLDDLSLAEGEGKDIKGGSGKSDALLDTEGLVGPAKGDAGRDDSGTAEDLR